MPTFSPGSWFVLERWIADSPYRFAAQPGQSDLDVARGSHAKEVLEHHWDSWVIEQDFAWIAARGLNTVRLPVRQIAVFVGRSCLETSLLRQIGYYHLCGADPSVLKGTDFEGLEHIYAGAWSRITTAIATANKFGLGVLLGELPDPCRLRLLEPVVLSTI